MYFIERLWAVADGQFGRAARGSIEKYTGTELSYTHQQDFNMSAYQDLKARSRSRPRELYEAPLSIYQGDARKQYRLLYTQFLCVTCMYMCNPLRRDAFDM